MKPTTFERRRKRVLEAAARLFAELDYQRVHMDAVAEAAEIAKPTIYRYFPTKEALFLDALDHTLSRLVADVARLRAQPSSAETRLRSAISLVFEEIGCLAPALRAIEAQGRDPDDRNRKALRRGFRALRDEIAALLDEGAAAGEFRVVDKEVAALAIVGAIRMTTVVGPGSDRSATVVADLLLGGLSQGAAFGGRIDRAPRAEVMEATS